ncbi:MAG: N-acetylglucosamine kinase [Bacteroidetes bacterium]|nr:N-acetylglucosamine kinase [Bacteroidota bacterium]MBU1372907.1 N-acetylglucosamine kinase [Bacteroidota bacterium]MBU1484171.1 N-acetylglucosamine kinase [Bacteroidota bacterium]MBU1759468.1 N-acetylglucosamine kinase [Bacteroidota bacterium]MBU2045845.1 N-acetylglucosamine kinase [Bacteroidota bacterium]
MLLVADGGSSKTDWILQLPDKSLERFHTSGLNPFFLSEKDIFRNLLQFKSFNDIADKVNEIHFFGAGCSSPDRRELVSNALTSRFKNAFISVENDLLGCALATCKKKPGFSCILGTESNISFFDGNNVLSNKHGLGYILGEEGSGTYFGKTLITDFLYQRAPEEIIDLFKKEFQLSKEIVIKNIYQKPMPNFYLASFAQFMSQHQEHPYIHQILKKGFHDFIKTHILSYPNYKDFYCHFVGSIGYHFKSILEETCSHYEVSVGKVLEKPIEELFQFIRIREGF